MITLISSDEEVMPDGMDLLDESAALALSDIPIKEIISEVRIARVNGEMVVNPTRSELAKSDMEFMIAATEKNLMMVEGESKECSEEDLINALQLAHDAIRVQIKAQEELRDKVGITSKREYAKPEQNEELREKVNVFCKERLSQVASSGNTKSKISDEFKTCHEMQKWSSTVTVQK